MIVVDSHAHFDPRMLTHDSLALKLDDAAVDKVVMIPALNDPLPNTPERLLALMRRLMRRAATRPLAEALHRVTLDAQGNLRFPHLPPLTIPIYPLPDNDSVLELMERSPERYLGWIFLNPAVDPQPLETLERYRAHKGFIGVKLHPHWHDYRTEILGPVLSRCEELALPVLIHLGFGRRGDFRTLAAAYPKLTLVAAHAGFPFYDDLWAYRNAHPNLHVDLSSPYIDEPLARAAVQHMGPERCLYGTDAPYGALERDGSYDYRTIRRWVERMPVSSAKREAMLGANFMALIGA